MFSSAALIFVLQPLFARMVTPLLGGSPQVWNTSMVFFQGALLAGYLYAHLLARLQDLRLQALIHAGVLVAAWFALPVQVSQALGPPNSEQPVGWLLGVLTLSVGAPFAAAAATAPLLQAWYARSSRADAHNPYYLYAASNLGSFVGLLGYPLLIEPALGAHAQSLAWSLAYSAVGALIALAAATALSNKAKASIPSAIATPVPSWRQRLYWMAAAAIPSAASLGVTLHLSTDIASVPLLWVIPLALYLLTFVIAFARGGELTQMASLFLHPLALAWLLMSYVWDGDWLGSMLGVLTGFFFAALVCHLALARARPEAGRLTEFYLCVSFGGVVGGAFAALAAPVLFNNVYEYPLAIAAACLLRPRAPTPTPRLENASLMAALGLTLTVAAVLLTDLNTQTGIFLLAGLAAAASVLAPVFGASSLRERYAALAAAVIHTGVFFFVALNADALFVAGEYQLLQAPWNLILIATSLVILGLSLQHAVQPSKAAQPTADWVHGMALAGAPLLLALALTGSRFGAAALTGAALTCCALALFFNRGRPALMASIVLAAFALVFLDDSNGSRIITQERTFFGVLRTRATPLPAQEGRPAAERRTLSHGTTLHGAQIVGDPTPLTYYNPRTSLGEAVLAGLARREHNSLALIGLGTGSTACLTSPGDELTIYEIDPAVVRLSALPGGDFTFVPMCQPDARLELGDARLRLAHAPDGAYDVIVVDAFSSDAIPAHLLTREAVALYLAKINEQGIVVLHLSNRNLALVSEAARVARDLNAPTLYRVNPEDIRDAEGVVVGNVTSVMVLARSPVVLATLPLASPWQVLRAPSGPSWSDDYINIARAFWENLGGGEDCVLAPETEACRRRAAR